VAAKQEGSRAGVLMMACLLASGQFRAHEVHLIRSPTTQLLLPNIQYVGPRCLTSSEYSISLLFSIRSISSTLRAKVVRDSTACM